MAFDLDNIFVNSLPGLAGAVDMAPQMLLNLPVASKTRCYLDLDNSADVLVEQTLYWMGITPMPYDTSMACELFVTTMSKQWAAADDVSQHARHAGATG